MELIKNKDWQHLTATYSWVNDMRGVPQDSRHHAEGDVAVHTQMVLAALVDMPAYKELNNEAQEILWMATLLHDVEKRSTTFTEADGSIVSPGHAKKGAHTARYILFTSFNVPFHIRESIVALVRYHGLPLWVFHKPDPLKALLAASLSLNTEWLCILARADVSGRICNDQQELLERIAFFEAYCMEQNCYGKPREFKSDKTRFHYFSMEDALPVYEPFDQPICEVTLMSGLPGMGKDNHLKKHCKDLPVISLDEIRRSHKLKPEDKSANGWTAQQAKEQARVYLRAKLDFVWNATNITKQMRSQLISLFTDYGARVKIVYVEQPYKTWLKQNLGRDYVVPITVMHKLLSKLEVPTIDEAHEVVYIP